MPLKTEINSPTMYDRVREAFYASSHHVDGHTYQPFFEHGQWWVEDLSSGAQWSVVDAVGGSAVDGFDFERITQGDEED